ncbi:hypothetical protein, partial [Brevundimonas sp.]|uniref:hypothetical protein n=1 Tax=Brevundimonas sp. TaxID=1871086 RepID=UPI00391C550F
MRALLRVLACAARQPDKTVRTDPAYQVAATAYAFQLPVRADVLIVAVFRRDVDPAEFVRDQRNLAGLSPSSRSTVTRYALTAHDALHQRRTAPPGPPRTSVIAAAAASAPVGTAAAAAAAGAAAAGSGADGGVMGAGMTSAAAAQSSAAAAAFPEQW